MRTRIALAALAALLFGALCGCQAAPEEAVVASKNDGAFEKALEAAPEETAGAAGEPATYTDSFTNTDGDITYQVELDIPQVTASMPVLRVRPKTITAECAKHVAEALFGDADIYEYSETRTKAELEELILSLRRRLSDPEAMEKYYGASADEIGRQMESVIEKYEAAYAAAPETAEAGLCGWEFHPRSWYYDEAWADENDPEVISYSKSQWIVAASRRDGIPYTYSVCNREEDDYRIHSITCEINRTLMDEELIYSTRPPSEAETAAARAEAEALLEDLNLGQWVIDSCVTRETGLPDGSSQYEIVATACPVYNGVKATHLRQLESLRTGDAYASNYYYEEMVFIFSGGHLVSFNYQSPLEAADVVNENVAILPFEDAMEKCESQLRMSLLAADPYASCDFYQAAGKNVNVYQAELGLVRTRVKGSSTDFYLLPAYTFRASYTLHDAEGNLLLDSRDLPDLIAQEILVVNAVDGSVINTELGY